MAKRAGWLIVAMVSLMTALNCETPAHDLTPSWMRLYSLPRQCMSSRSKEGRDVASWQPS